MCVGVDDGAWVQDARACVVGGAATCTLPTFALPQLPPSRLRLTRSLTHMLLLRLAVSTQRSVQLRAVALPLQRRRRQDCRDAVRSLSTSSHLCRGSESDKAASTKDADAATTSSSSLKSSASGVRITDKRTAAAQAAAAAASSKEQQSATRSGSDDAVEPLSNEELLKKRMRMAQQRLENPSYGVAVEAVSSSSSSLSEASLKDAAAAAAAPFFPASTSSLAGANSSLNSTPRLAPQQSAAAHQSTAQADEPSSAASGSSSVEEHHFAAAARAERRGAAVEQGGSSSDAAAGGGEGVTLEQDGVLSTTMTSPSTGALQGSSSSSSSYSRPARITHPFDTHAFVERLLQAGFRNAPVNVDMSLSEDTQLQLGTRNPHDPAEALMQATRHLLITRSEAVLERNLNKTQVENVSGYTCRKAPELAQASAAPRLLFAECTDTTPLLCLEQEAYLFSAALSELRTELQVRARSDAAALRSITTLLQREVDGLGQRMNEEINTLKHE